MTFPGTSIAYGYKTSYVYDTLNNLTTVNQGVQTRTFAYSSLSRLLSAQNPESGTISYQYDPNGNLTSKTDARSITTSYSYDALNRVTQRTYSDSTLPVYYTYDNLSHAKGKLTKVTTGSGSTPFSVTEYTEFDAVGRVKKSRQTTDGTVYNEMEYTYNLSGALVEQKYPSGRVVRNVLDNDGDLSMVQSKRNANYGYWNYARHFTYTAAGAVSSMQLGNGAWEKTAFNSRLQPTEIALGRVPNATDLLKLDYTYGVIENNQLNTAKNNGNIQSQTITVPTVGNSNGFTAVQTYNYDSLNRIDDAKEMIGSTETWKQDYTFDRYGNRNFDEANTTTIPKNCGTPPNLTVCEEDRKVFNPNVNASNNRLSASDGYQFDAAGNTIRDPQNRKFTYDAENKQTKVESVDSNGNVTGTIGEYAYDGDGRRVKKIAYTNNQVTETTVFLYDASSRLVAEYSTILNETPQVAYLTNDHLGSPRINTNENGAVVSRHDYRPYGEEVTERTHIQYAADTIRKQFTGYERDGETDLDFAQARYFSSRLARFSVPDDFTKDSIVSAPESWNKYVYARNNPLKFIDPEGERADVTITTDEKNKTITITVKASIVFYGEKGVSNTDRDAAASKASQKIADAWSGTFRTKDGFTVVVTTTITYTTRDSKEDAEATGMQNVVGLVNGPATKKADSISGSGGFDLLSDKPDYGRWNIHSVNNAAVAQHEFGHLLGVGDRYLGNDLMNTNLLLNSSNSTVATESDYRWTFQGSIDSHRENSRPREYGREWETTNASPGKRGKPTSQTSTTTFRAGRIWWN